MRINQNIFFCLCPFSQVPLNFLGSVFWDYGFACDRGWGLACYHFVDVGLVL